MNIVTLVIEQVANIFQNLFILPLTNIVDYVVDTITDFSGNAIQNTAVLEFCGACIKTFVPYRAIITSIAIITPALLLNLGIAVILRVKSFIPTMGH